MQIYAKQWIILFGARYYNIYLFFAIYHCIFISHREHNAIRDNIQFAPCWTSSVYI